MSKDAQLNYESGERSHNAAYLQAIADAGVDVLYVLTGKRQSGEALPEEIRTLVRAYEYADKDGRAALQMVSLLVHHRADGSSGRRRREHRTLIRLDGAERGRCWHRVTQEVSERQVRRGQHAGALALQSAA